MADKKISALTAAALPLAGTEVLPIVQSGATVKVATDDLTVKNIRSNATSGLLQVTGPAAASTRVMTTPDANFTVARTDAAQSFTGDQTLSTGNLIIGTSGKGIDFSITSHPAGMTSELLADYEEGTWTPTYYGAAGSAGSLAYAEQTGKYTKIGRQVTVTGTIILTNKGSWTGRVQIGGFPFTPTADQYSGQIELRNCTFTGNYVVMEIGRAASSFARFVIVSGSGANTQIEDTNVANNSGFLFTLTYMV